MRLLPHLFEKNEAWSNKMKESEPDFFENLSHQQSPDYLWIGCSDSRVPANQIVGLPPGELFVHRNVANIVLHTDINCLSVMEYAVEVLQVKHIMVVGHYGCGGVAAALRDNQLALIDNWLREIRGIARRYDNILKSLPSEQDRLNRLCELNVVEQVKTVCNTTIVQKAWQRNQSLSVHGWVYGLHNGLLHDLDVCTSSPTELSLLQAKVQI